MFNCQAAAEQLTGQSLLVNSFSEAGAHSPIDLIEGSDDCPGEVLV
jgi:hypothetical protein